MRLVKSGEVKIRITAGMKRELEKLALSKHTSPSELGRNAIRDLLLGAGVPLEEINSDTQGDVEQMADMAAADLKLLRGVAKPKAPKRPRRRGTS